MAFPVIGVTTSNGTQLGYDAIILMRSYVQALTEAGGVPVLIPTGLMAESWHSLYERLDGILFSGGGDIGIRRFGGQPHKEIRPADDERDEVEFALVEAAVCDRKPFLGICRGFQVINVALGGTLYTHIKDQMPNALQHKYSSKTRRAYLAHAVEVAEGSRLADVLGQTEFQVNSMHHQGAKDIAAALKPVAYAPDGLVEAVELPDYPFGIAVQWHPECIPDQPVSPRLFREFVEAAEDNNKR
jgi:putative glutamine amidotransferase